jgi:hypothetical protein
MPALKPISREYRIYLALWRKAVKSPEMVSITTKDFSMAVAMRQGMYRAIRPFRNGQAVDEELRMASERYVIYLIKAEDKHEPHFLELRPRMTLAALEASWDALGIDEEDLLLGDERKADASLERLLKESQAPEAKPAPTPFYTREQ